MNYTFRDLDEVKKEAIAFKQGYPVYFYTPGQEFPERYSPDADFLQKWQRCYSVNNGVIAYVDGDTVYVIPSMANALDIVKYSGNDYDRFQRMSHVTDNNFFVPLSNGEYPENFGLREHWNFLRTLQSELFSRQ